MELSKEILAYYLAQENAQILFPNLQLNAKEIVEIVCAFEHIGSDGGSRHDFG